MEYSSLNQHRALDDDEDLDDLASELVNSQAPKFRQPDPDYDKKTKRMSEMLLLGYTMLEDCCDGRLR